MALQDIPYLTATWTAPASDLTDYVGYFDLSNAPQSWWDEVDTSDGTKGRVAKDDAAEGATTATELASEWVNFDDVAQTGQLWFRWSGTLSATSPNDVRIYPPKASVTSYGVTNTFGRNAVYTNYHAVWHLNEDPSGTAPQFTDVTGNGRDLTSNGSMTSADQVAGKIGNAIDFDGVDDYLRTTTMDFTGTGPCTVQFWNNVLTGDGGGSAFGEQDTANSERIQAHAPFTDDNLYWYYGTPSNTELSAAYTSFYDKWTMIHLIGDEGFQEIFFDGTSQNSASNGATRPTFTTLDIGEYSGGYHDGQIDEFRVSLSILPNDFISLEYSNQNNVGTFWSSITLDNSGGAQTMSVTLGAITYGASASGAATAGMSTNHPITYDMSEGAAASASHNTQFPISYDLSSSNTATVAQAISMGITYALSVSMIEKVTMSVSMGTYTLDMTTDNSASAAANISQAIAYDLTSSGTASAAMSAGLAISYAMQASAAAAASMDASMGYTIDLSVSAQTVTSVVTLSDGRTFTISVDLRTFSIDEEQRTLNISNENRTLSIDP